MPQAIVITPVKDSVETTLKTIASIQASHPNTEHIVYNDFSTSETLEILEAHTAQFGFELVNLSDITDTPSPNYNLVLQDAQKRALESGRHLIVVESDVIVKPDTLSQLTAFANQHQDTGLLGAITIDESGQVNFPYLKFKDTKEEVIDTKRSLSFCCTLMSLDFLKKYNFTDLDQSKDWYDTTLSGKAIALGFKNRVLKHLTVIHHPHGSRPWKQLKYKNPLKYYFNKLIKGRDKI